MTEIKVFLIGYYR